jgi:hypothetical protein
VSAGAGERDHDRAAHPGHDQAEDGLERASAASDEDRVRVGQDRQRGWSRAVDHPHGDTVTLGVGGQQLARERVALDRDHRGA